MDRSRIVVALALALSLLSVIVGLASISVASRDSEFRSPAEGLFSGGRAGIALIEIHGVIKDGRGSGGDAGADKIIGRLKEAEESGSVKAIILSINSPGGAVGATKKIYDAVRQVRQKKPVIAVVSDMAASGGYYAAAACDRIFAYEGSVIGSIGVIAFHPNVSGFLNQHGVTVTPLKAGRFKDSSYPFREMTPEEREMEQRLLDDAYQMFVKDVAEGRAQPLTSVNRWAEGRIFSGKSARLEEMISNIGGRDDAVIEIKRMLKTTRDLPILEPKREFWDEILEGVPFGARARRLDSGSLGTIYYLHPAGLPGELVDFLMQTRR